MTICIKYLELSAATGLAVSEIIEATENPSCVAVGIDEYDEARELWSVSAYYEECPEQDYLKWLAGIIELTLGIDKIPWSTETVPEANWVQKSLEGLSPVKAGRFFVHGAHDHASRPVNSISIELEAGMAFGTGHHGTTKGCLMAFDALLKHQRFNRILDIGTGTGILAIAAAKALRTKIVASDIDPVAVQHAALNAHNNGVGKYVKTHLSTGVDNHVIAANGPYNLIFANILARPLAGMAYDVGSIAAPGAFVILSGILPQQSRFVECAYRTQGFVVSKRYSIENWVTLCLHA